jgi:DNA-binding transcriptional MerR regulator
MAGQGLYTAEQLAFKAGIPLRTVRYYVQEKLIDPPLGRGPGAHYDDRHLHQIQRARIYQFGGFDNQTIRRHADELETILKARGLNVGTIMTFWSALAQVGGVRPQGVLAQDGPPTPAADTDVFDAETALRIPMAQGVDLLIADGVEPPSPRALVDIAFLIRKTFGLK